MQSHSRLLIKFTCSFLLLVIVCLGLKFAFSLATLPRAKAQTKAPRHHDCYTQVQENYLKTNFMDSSLAVSKEVTPANNVPLGDIITYTITLANSSDALAIDVIMTDDLPSGVTFGGWLQRGSASLLFPPASEPIIWGPHDIPPQDSIILRFTATVTTSNAYYGSAITNTVQYTSTNVGYGFSQATFNTEKACLYLPLIMKSFPPIPNAKFVKINNDARYTYRITTTLALSATLKEDVVREVRLSNDGTHWSTWQTFTQTTNWTLDSSNGLKTVYVQFKGGLGGVSKIISDDILLFINGDFSQEITNWSQAGELPISWNDGTALLGEAGSGCHYDEAGYASLEQSFIMPDNVPSNSYLVLKFTYHMYSYDRNISLTNRYDRFDVLFDSDVVFKDANEDDFDGCNLLNDLGKQSGEIIVTGESKEQIKAEFRMYNRPDRLYKTYVYLDDVHLEFVQQDNLSAKR